MPARGDWGSSHRRHIVENATNWPPCLDSRGRRGIISRSTGSTTRLPSARCVSGARPRA